MTFFGSNFNFGGFTSGDSAFVPSGTPVAWYDASAITGLSDNDSVAQWDDSASTNHLVQAVGAQQPIYKTAVQNNKPGVYSDGSAQQNLSVTLGASASQTNTIFIVCKPDTGEAGLDIVFDSTGSGARQAVYTTGSPADWYMYAGSQYGGNALRTNVAQVLVATFKGASSTLRINGSQVDTGNAGTNALDGIRLFDSTGGNDEFKGYIFEVIVYDGEESPAANEAGLITKWGI